MALITALEAPDGTSAWHYGTGVTQSAGTVTVPVTSSIEEFNSVATYDCRNASVQMKLTLASAGTGTKQVEFSLRDSGGTNMLAWVWNGSSLTPFYTVAGTNTFGTAITGLTAAVWVRIAELSGTTTWSYSTNGTSWTTAQSLSDPLSSTLMQALEVYGLGYYYGTESASNSTFSAYVVSGSSSSGSSTAADTITVGGGSAAAHSGHSTTASDTISVGGGSASATGIKNSAAFFAFFQRLGTVRSAGGGSSTAHDTISVGGGSASASVVSAGGGSTTAGDTISVGGGSASASGSGDPPVINDSTVPIGGGAVLNASSPTMNSTTADNCGLIVLQGWETTLAEQAKTDNPDCIVLMYKDSAEASNASTTLADVDSGVTYATASSEGWLLESGGSPILLNGYSGQYATDIGNTDYQAAWAENVIGLLDGSPFDGVFCDDINTSISDLTGTIYASAGTYATAMGSWCEAVGPTIADAGYVVIGNFGSWWLNTTTMNPWLAYFHGAMMEFFGGFYSSGTFTPSGYSTTMLTVAQYAAAQEKYFWAVYQGAPTDTAHATYVTAMLLLASPGSSFVLAYSDTTVYDVAEWPAVFATAQSLGEASGAATHSGSVYTREFANGSVSVDFSANTGTIST